MGNQGVEKQKLALVFGNLPRPEEIDQFRLLKDAFDITCVSTESICGYLNETSRFDNLKCLALPDHEDNPTYVPGLESVLSEFDVVVVKERLGLYSYQAVKAKWKSKFRLAIWADNLAVLPAEDVDQMRTIRQEVTNAADAFIVQSDAAVDSLKLEGIEPERILKFAPWVEKISKRSKKVRAGSLKAMDLPESCFLVAHVGQIEWEEGLNDLVAGIKLAAEQDASLRNKLKVVFCGIGSFAPQLKQTLIALGIDDRALFVAPSREAFITIYNAADVVFMGSSPSRDRVDGDVYKIVNAMTNEVPILANRTPVIEETCGKHRIDFCFSSPGSIADGIVKAAGASSLLTNMTKKNSTSAKANFSEKQSREGLDRVFAQILSQSASIDEASLDHQVRDIESLVVSKQYLKAIDVIESVFKIENIPVHHSANLYRLIGDCFAKLSDNDGAKNAYIKAVELDPYSAKAYIGLGTVCLIKQSNDIAVLHFQKAVSLAPQDDMAYLGLGLAFQGLGELDEAHSWVKKSIDMSVENSAALYTLVRIAYEREDYIDAEVCVLKYLEAHPHDYNMLFTLGGLQFRMGKHQKVVELMHEIIKIDPMDARAHALMKQAEGALNQVETSNG